MWQQSLMNSFCFLNISGPRWFTTSQVITSSCPPYLFRYGSLTFCSHVIISRIQCLLDWNPLSQGHLPRCVCDSNVNTAAALWLFARESGWDIDWVYRSFIIGEELILQYSKCIYGGDYNQSDSDSDTVPPSSVAALSCLNVRSLNIFHFHPGKNLR